MSWRVKNGGDWIVVVAGSIQIRTKHGLSVDSSAFTTQRRSSRLLRRRDAEVHKNRARKNTK